MPLSPRRRAAAQAPPAAVSARKLAAALWGLRPWETKIDLSRANCKSGSCSVQQCPHCCEAGEFEACMKLLDYGTMKKAMKRDQNDIPETYYSSKHGATYSARSLKLELHCAGNRIAELESKRRTAKRRFGRFLKTLCEETASREKAEHKRALGRVRAIKNDVNAEKKRRRRAEAANARLADQLAKTNLFAKKCRKEYRKEKESRDLMEQLCEELSKEMDGDRIFAEEIRRESEAARGEAEEEKRMLQAAEVCREERVQMKLAGVRLALEHKYSQLSTLESEIEHFLSIHRGKTGNRCGFIARNLNICQPKEQERSFLSPLSPSGGSSEVSFLTPQHRGMQGNAESSSARAAGNLNLKTKSRKKVVSKVRRHS